MTASILDDLAPALGHVQGYGDGERVQQRHPWYSPSASLTENAERCAGHRLSQQAKGLGHYGTGGKWIDRRN